MSLQKVIVWQIYCWWQSRERGSRPRTIKFWLRVKWCDVCQVRSETRSSGNLSAGGIQHDAAADSVYDGGRCWNIETTHLLRVKRLSTLVYWRILIAKVVLKLSVPTQLYTEQHINDHLARLINDKLCIHKGETCKYKALQISNFTLGCEHKNIFSRAYLTN